MLITALRPTVEQFVTWGLRRERQGGKGIHNQVDPKHLNRSQSLFREDNCTGENDKQRDNIYSKLELEELFNVIVNVTSVFNRGLN